METQTDAITVIFYTLTGALATALCVIIWKYFMKLDETVTAFKEEMVDMKVNQAVHNERIARVERWDIDMIKDIINDSVAALEKKKR